MFKFSFKLGGDEDLEENTAVKKKNKNKKKKKKPAAGSAGVNGTENVDEHDKDELAAEIGAVDASNDAVVDVVGDSLSQVCISGEEVSSVGTTPVEDKPLSKSQKKNLQKKNAKKASEAQPLAADAPPRTTDIPLKSKPNQQPKEAANVVKSDINAAVTISDDEFAIPEPKAPKNKKPKAQPKPKSKATHDPKPTGLAFAHLAAPEPPKGPHFISSKDPELDEATKLRFKYGMGRNLVAIGPAKVRDPNWLPPPPGLTRSTPLTGVFSNTCASKVSSPVKATPAKTNAADTAGAEEVHSSPFSFSFNGL